MDRDGEGGKKPAAFFSLLLLLLLCTDALPVFCSEYDFLFCANASFSLRKMFGWSFKRF